VADDNAISDTVYFLARALNSERIDLATFMKVTYYFFFINMILNNLIHLVYAYVIKRTVYEESIDQENNGNVK
jgi:hypothetical protein